MPCPPASPATSTPHGRTGFADRVRDQFGRHAADYEGEARLQRGIAWRLARLCRGLPLRAGPCADLGAGSGLLSRALTIHADALAEAARSPLQLDLCPELLARNPLPHRRTWDLNTGLPEDLHGAALLASSFALQWLARPEAALRQWCRHLAPGGWLVLALPTAGSFPQWRQAAQAAAVPCSALPLPEATALERAAREEGLALRHSRVLRFSQPGAGPLESLRALRRLGAAASPTRPLTACELRRLLRHWPGGGGLSWEVLLLVGRQPENEPCAW